jgi:hypothetical protein
MKEHTLDTLMTKAGQLMEEELKTQGNQWLMYSEITYAEIIKSLLVKHKKINLGNGEVFLFTLCKMQMKSYSGMEATVENFTSFTAQEAMESWFDAVAVLREAYEERAESMDVMSYRAMEESMTATILSLDYASAKELRSQVKVSIVNLFCILVNYLTRDE